MNAVRWRMVSKGFCILTASIVSELLCATGVELNHNYSLSVAIQWDNITFDEVHERLSREKIKSIGEFRDSCSSSNDGKFVRVLLLNDNVVVIAAQKAPASWVIAGAMTLICVDAEEDFN